MGIRFDGQVAVITGAGGGLGRVYALDLARRGCKVVINDLGVDVHGTSKNANSADIVVEEIRKAGGTAVANYDSVEFGERIIATAIKSFGRLDLVIKVHLNGAYACTKAAWMYMKKQNYGRIVFTSSNAAIFGSFGQTNYASAKYGMVGFAQSLAIEGERYNIKSNVIVPTAGSRMTVTIMPKSMLEQFDPKHVVPMVVYLASKDCEVTGRTMQAGAGWFGEVRLLFTKGMVMTKATAEDIKTNWKTLTNADNGIHFVDVKEMGEAVVEAVNKGKSRL